MTLEEIIAAKFDDLIQSLDGSINWNSPALCLVAKIDEFQASYPMSDCKQHKKKCIQQIKAFLIRVAGENPIDEDRISITYKILSPATTHTRDSFTTATAMAARTSFFLSSELASQSSLTDEESDEETQQLLSQKSPPKQLSTVTDQTKALPTANKKPPLQRRPRFYGTLPAELAPLTPQQSTAALHDEAPTKPTLSGL